MFRGSAAKPFFWVKRARRETPEKANRVLGPATKCPHRKTSHFGPQTKKMMLPWAKSLRILEAIINKRGKTSLLPAKWPRKAEKGCCFALEEGSVCFVCCVCCFQTGDNVSRALVGWHEAQTSVWVAIERRENPSRPSWEHHRCGTRPHLHPGHAGDAN